jgi:prepilin-type N-terminal cleavage/methylation domain-containing protein
MRRGLTLIEMLVAIGVIGLLIAILTPALSGARTLALEAVSLNNARQCWSVVDDYASANQDLYPRCRPNVVYGPPGMGGIAVSNEVAASFLTTAHWYGVVRDVAPFHEYRKIFVSPGAVTTEDIGFAASYRFVPAFTAKGALWTPAAESMTPEQLAALATDIRRSEVAYPASKVGMYDGDVSYVRRAPPRVDGLPNMKVAMAFADGHAKALNPQDASEPFPNALLPEQPAIRLHDTPGGAQGRDY